MEKLKRKTQVVIIVLTPLFLCACLSFNIIENVKDPSRYFKKAHRQIEEIHKQYPNREGRPHHINLLIYDGSDRDLIELTVPLWLADGCVDLGKSMAEIEHESDFDEKYDFDWEAIEDLGQLGPGLLVEIEDEKDRILIWLQ